MGKIAEIINADQKRTFDLIRESDALYLSVKCSDNEKHSKVLKIKLSDVLYQVWKHMTFREKRELFQFFNRMVADKKSA
jgi:hypothetical protein